MSYVTPRQELLPLVEFTDYLFFLSLERSRYLPPIPPGVQSPIKLLFTKILLISLLIDMRFEGFVIKRLWFWYLPVPDGTEKRSVSETESTVPILSMF